MQLDKHLIIKFFLSEFVSALTERDPMLGGHSSIVESAVAEQDYFQLQEGEKKFAIGIAEASFSSPLFNEDGNLLPDSALQAGLNISPNLRFFLKASSYPSNFSDKQKIVLESVLQAIYRRLQARLEKTKQELASSTLVQELAPQRKSLSASINEVLYEICGDVRKILIETVTFDATDLIGIRLSLQAKQRLLRTMFQLGETRLVLINHTKTTCHPYTITQPWQLSLHLQALQDKQVSDVIIFEPISVSGDLKEGGINYFIPDENGTITLPEGCTPAQLKAKVVARVGRIVSYEVSLPSHFVQVHHFPLNSDSPSLHSQEIVYLRQVGSKRTLKVLQGMNEHLLMSAQVIYCLEPDIKTKASFKQFAKIFQGALEQTAMERIDAVTDTIVPSPISDIYLWRAILSILQSLHLERNESLSSELQILQARLAANDIPTLLELKQLPGLPQELALATELGVVARFVLNHRVNRMSDKVAAAAPEWLYDVMAAALPTCAATLPEQLKHLRDHFISIYECYGQEKPFWLEVVKANVFRVAVSLPAVKHTLETTLINQLADELLSQAVNIEKNITRVLLSGQDSDNYLEHAWTASIAAWQTALVKFNELLHGLSTDVLDKVTTEEKIQHAALCLERSSKLASGFQQPFFIEYLKSAQAIEVKIQRLLEIAALNRLEPSKWLSDLSFNGREKILQQKFPGLLLQFTRFILGCKQETTFNKQRLIRAHNLLDQDVDLLKTQIIASIPDERVPADSVLAATRKEMTLRLVPHLQLEGKLLHSFELRQTACHQRVAAYSALVANKQHQLTSNTQLAQEAWLSRYLWPELMLQIQEGTLSSTILIVHHHAERDLTTYQLHPDIMALEAFDESQLPRGHVTTEDVPIFALLFELDVLAEQFAKSDDVQERSDLLKQYQRRCARAFGHMEVEKIQQKRRLQMQAEIAKGKAVKMAEAGMSSISDVELKLTEPPISIKVIKDTIPKDILVNVDVFLRKTDGAIADPLFASLLYKLTQLGTRLHLVSDNPKVTDELVNIQQMLEAKKIKVCSVRGITSDSFVAGMSAQQAHIRMQQFADLVGNIVSDLQLTPQLSLLVDRKRRLDMSPGMASPFFPIKREVIGLLAQRKVNVNEHDALIQRLGYQFNFLRPCIAFFNSAAMPQKQHLNAFTYSLFEFFHHGFNHTLLVFDIPLIVFEEKLADFVKQFSLGQLSTLLGMALAPKLAVVTDEAMKAQQKRVLEELQVKTPYKSHIPAFHAVLQQLDLDNPGLFKHITGSLEQYKVLLEAFVKADNQQGSMADYLYAQMIHLGVMHEGVFIPWQLEDKQDDDELDGLREKLAHVFRQQYVSAALACHGALQKAKPDTARANDDAMVRLFKGITRGAQQLLDQLFTKQCQPMAAEAALEWFNILEWCQKSMNIYLTSSGMQHEQVVSQLSLKLTLYKRILFPTGSAAVWSHAELLQHFLCRYELLQQAFPEGVTISSKNQWKLNNAKDELLTCLKQRVYLDITKQLKKIQYAVCDYLRAGFRPGDPRLIELIRMQQNMAALYAEHVHSAEIRNALGMLSQIHQWVSPSTGGACFASVVLSNWNDSLPAFFKMQLKVSCYQLLKEQLCALEKAYVEASLAPSALTERDDEHFKELKTVHEYFTNLFGYTALEYRFKRLSWLVSHRHDVLGIQWEPGTERLLLDETLEPHLLHHHLNTVSNDIKIDPDLASLIRSEQTRYKLDVFDAYTKYLLQRINECLPEAIPPGVITGVREIVAYLQEKITLIPVSSMHYTIAQMKQLKSLLTEIEQLDAHYQALYAHEGQPFMHQLNCLAGPEPERLAVTSELVMRLEQQEAKLKLQALKANIERRAIKADWHYGWFEPRANIEIIREEGIRGTYTVPKIIASQYENVSRLLAEEGIGSEYMTAWNNIVTDEQLGKHLKRSSASSFFVSFTSGADNGVEMPPSQRSGATQPEGRL